MTNNHSNQIQLTAFQLKIIAMMAMVCDHAAKTIYFGFGTNALLHIGRIAFPIFAFQLVEGYFKTKDFKKYCKRLLLFALLSEIPYNLTVGLSSYFNPFAQNVLWTMLIGLFVLKAIDKLSARDLNRYIKTAAIAGVILLGYLIGTITMVDYSGEGVLTFVLFYFSRKFKHRHIIELAGLIIINIFLLGGRVGFLHIGSMELSYPLQAIAVLSLIPIWLYKGKQGYHSKAWTYFCYCFYPLHIILLIVIGHLLYS